MHAHRSRSPFFAVLAALMVAGCGETPSETAMVPLLQIVERDDVTFMTQTMDPIINTDALYVGKVILAEDGCLRLAETEEYTVIWPLSFRFTQEGGHLSIIDGAGEVRGHVDGEFRLGGGEVAELHEGLGFTEVDRTRAAQNCPGKYWLAHSVG